MSSAPRGLAPCEGLKLGLMKTGRTGPPLSHATGRRQESLGTPVPRTPTEKKKLQLEIVLTMVLTQTLVCSVALAS